MPELLLVATCATFGSAACAVDRSAGAAGVSGVGTVQLDLAGPGAARVVQLFLDGPNKRILRDPPVNALLRDLPVGNYSISAAGPCISHEGSSFSVQAGAVTKVELFIHYHEEPSSLPGETRRIHGTVAVEEQNARTVPRTGSIEFDLENMWGIRTAPVIDGRWTLSLPDGIDVMSICRLVLDGRAAHCVGELSDYGNEPEYALEAHWTPRSTLVAFDADTNERIAEVILVCEDKFNKGMNPARWEGFALRAIPVEVTAWDPRDENLGWDFIHDRRWWVRASGYAWTCVEIDHAIGGEHRIALRKASPARSR